MKSSVASLDRAKISLADRAFLADLVGLVPTLTRRAQRLAGNPSDAEDLVHDTVLRAIEFQGSFAPGTNLRGWANKILFSVFVSRCRRRRRERLALDLLGADPCAWPHQDCPPAMRRLGPRMESALSAIPEQFAAAVRLVDLHELSYRDAASELRVPVGTVMSRLFRGRKLLASSLGETASASSAAA
jgi:RNA polymerase sigma-70 factor (ECF subfamily)